MPSMPSVESLHELSELESFFSKPATSRDSLGVTDRAIQLAALGYAEAVLELTQRTSQKALFKPLADGIQLHLGKVIESTGAARSLAIYIAGRITQETSRHLTV